MDYRIPYNGLSKGGFHLSKISVKDTFKLSLYYSYCISSEINYIA